MSNDVHNWVRGSERGEKWQLRNERPLKECCQRYSSMSIANPESSNHRFEDQLRGGRKTIDEFFRFSFLHSKRIYRGSECHALMASRLR